MSWLYPWALAALVLVPLLYLYLAYVKKPPTLVVPTVRPFRSGSGGRKRRRIGFSEGCFLAALTLLIAACARPRRGDEKIVLRARGIDMIFALDMSGSMNAIDLPEQVGTRQELAAALRSGELRSRFDTAVREIGRFVKLRPNDRIGLVGFAEFAYSFVPPTLDHDWLLTRLGTLKPGQIGDGTGIAAPIVSAASRLKNSDSPRRVLVLFTDGADNVAHRVTPEQAAAIAKECKVTIHTVGIGGDRAVMVADTPFGRQLHTYAGQFDEARLRRLAELSGGRCFRAGDAAGLREVMEQINRLETTSREQPKFIEYREYAPYLALGAAALLFAGFVAMHTWKLRLP
ncbi:MAG: VWA domain-containing protein [Lentisphaeria bacterium]|nr:VWA domain-containing protein [Lentisphaeria bacterium]